MFRLRYAFLLLKKHFSLQSAFSKFSNFPIIGIILTDFAVFCYQQRSLEVGEVLEPKSNFLFQPLARKIADTALTDCVLAFRYHTIL